MGGGALKGNVTLRRIKENCRNLGFVRGLLGLLGWNRGRCSQKPWGFEMEENTHNFVLGPLARRPLMGLTILLVEDSRYCSEAVRLMSQRSGARLRRADCLKSARRHLKIYRPDVVMIDIGLPDGSGVDLICELRVAPAPAPAIVALSGDDGGLVRAQALEAGASCFLTKPLQDITSFQRVIITVLKDCSVTKPFIPQIVGKPLVLDQQAFVDDLVQVGKLLAPALVKQDRIEMRYLAQFARSVAQAAQDHELMDCASAFLARLKGGGTWLKSGKRVLMMVQRRLNKTQNI